MKTTPQLNEDRVPFERVAKFVRQLTHDVRNGLSAIDLESAYIAELVTDPEVTDEIRKLRGIVANTARMLRDLSQNFQPVVLHAMPWQAIVFVEELQARLLKQFPEETREGLLETDWKVGAHTIQIDLEQLMAAAFHVLRNAFAFRREGTPVQLSAFAEGAWVVLEIREPKETLDSSIPLGEWGLEPFNTTRAGGYGLGLYRARQILHAHGGELETRYEKNVLITRLLLPICPNSPE